MVTTQEDPADTTTTTTAPSSRSTAPPTSVDPAQPIELAWVRQVGGLGNDELGYIIPPFQFELHDTVPWFDEAEGDHYEETNALSPTMGPRLDEELVRLTTWAYAAWPTAR